MQYILSMIAGVIVAVISYHGDDLGSLFAEQPSSYKQAVTYSIDRESNICRSTGGFFDITVQVVYEDLPEPTIGEWRPLDNTIVIDQKSMDVIAHEVHHMVDTTMERHRVRDDHYAAHLQGAYTSCVFEIVANDYGVSY
jgi:hypothetical protein